MCGFAAIIPLNGSTVDPSMLAAMSESIAHRGPDGAGEAMVSGVGLAHRRLAIIDPAGGAQPMARRHVTLAYNGALYNDAEVRTELQSAGWGFDTTSDTETLCAAISHEWHGALPKLNGMFAFVAVDSRRRRVLAARDHMGIKPLYWTRTADAILLASEIKALLAHPGVARTVSEEALQDYLTFQFVLGDATLFRGIRRIRPGSWMEVDLDSGVISLGQWWAPSWEVGEHTHVRDVVEELRTLVNDSVRRQLRSDVPLGSYLSGGLDSSLVTTIAARQLGEGLPVFTGAFDEGAAFDERVYARQVAAAARATMHEVIPTQADFVELLPGLIRQMDEPVAGPGLFPQFVVARRAAQHVKVMLGGQGGDEVFGGYARYLIAYLEQALKGAIHESNDEGEHIVSLASLVPHLPHLRSYGPMLQRFWRDGLFEPMDRRYFRLIDRSESTLALLATDRRATFNGDAVFARFAKAFNAPDTKSYLARMTHFDLTESLPALLQVEDRVSMAVGIESRVPLLDPRIIARIASLPPRLKFNGGEPKHLLRRVAQGQVPAAIMRRRDKMGFPVPMHRWRSGVAGAFMADVLLSERARTRGLFDRVAMIRQMESDEPFDRKLWGALSLELWFSTWFDTAPAAVPSRQRVADLTARLHQNTRTA